MIKKTFLIISDGSCRWGEIIAYLGNKQYCYPLTITDYHSRFLLACEALGSTKEQFAFTIFERAFKEYGIPNAIRTDNGLPFSAPNALHGLSRLSVWWLRLGISIERIRPGNPQENGRHERMHLTLKKETTKPPEYNFLQQQQRFDGFQEVYNNQRPHQAIGMRYPGELYTPSSRRYVGLPELEYPFHEKVITGERGEQNVSIQNLIQIALTLKVEVGELIPPHKQLINL